MSETKFWDGCVDVHEGCAYAEVTAPTPHLPECRAAGLGLWPSSGLCMCDELRACEERVLDAARDAVAAVVDRLPGFYATDSHPRGES